MLDSSHYFDWAATAPADPDILREALDFSLEHWGNPSSIHGAGSDAREALERCRSDVAAVLGVPAGSIYFTSGGTESDHLPLLSVLNRPQKGSVLLSQLEHPANREMAKSLSACGWKVIEVKADKDGIVSPESVIGSLQDDSVYVCVMAVNNETGAIQPIYDIADALEDWGSKRRKPFFHVDCVQAAGKIELDLAHKGIDSAAFSAHKIRGPRGIGLLYAAKSFTPFLRGGGQEKGVRSGTENLFGAKAFALALDRYYIHKGNPASLSRLERQREWTRNFIRGLLEIKGVRMLPYNREDEANEGSYSPWVVQAAFPGIPGQVMERALSVDGFYISTGSACSSGSHARPILDSLGISAAEKEAAVRFSFGSETTQEAMVELLEEVRGVAEKFLA
ncbi:MAG: cysteine desulfurase [Treponema sp.]|nr:cysteine desulfurase [Treponema sp.]